MPVPHDHHDQAPLPVPLHKRFLGHTQNPDQPAVEGISWAGADAIFGTVLPEGSPHSGHAIRGESHHEGGNGVLGINFTKSAGVSAVNRSGHADGIGVYAKGAVAGFFDGRLVVLGNIEVSGDILLPSADVAEEFDILDGAVEPGTVMVLGEGGALRPCDEPYDKRVAGIISGAGLYKPAVILDKKRSPGRMPIALVGKAFCKVDASEAPIHVGDLLTTSMIPGHAMKARDDSRALGAVIGKALQSLTTGRALLPVFVALR